ncbi:hypothetical protein [Burkholderia sp. AU4i]|uniref:hypothetical protein n=1 Tax=Burkholderia sp. AU4i TaxID=1335308 RepID=UPI0005B342E9|nr:hypothetical protein [Burkholderia sp. AU4i]
MNNPDDRQVVDLQAVLLKSRVVTVSLPSGPLDPVDCQFTRSLLGQAVTMSVCTAALRPIIADMKFEYEASVRGAESPGNA